MQAWGMTEALGGSAATMKPGAADLPFEQRIDQRMKSGRALFGNRYRIVDDDGKELPHDGVAFGHLRVKSPWVSNGYFKGEGGSAVDEQGWLKTGDLATIDARRLHLADRPLQGRHQVRRRMDQQHRAGERRLGPPGGAAGGGHRHRPPQVAGAAAAGGDEARGRVADRSRADRLHARQGGQLVAARRRWTSSTQMPLTGTGKLWKLKLREQLQGLPAQGMKRRRLARRDRFRAGPRDALAARSGGRPVAPGACTMTTRRRTTCCAARCMARGPVSGVVWQARARESPPGASPIAPT